MADRNGMIWLPPALALELHFANNGSKSTTAEIKLLNMTPYLKIEQVHRLDTTRVIFTCHDRAVRVIFGIVTDTVSAKS